MRRKPLSHWATLVLVRDTTQAHTWHRPLSLRRSDGRVDQFRCAAMPFEVQRDAEFAWHRAQEEPGGRYSPWQPICPVPVGPRTCVLCAAEDAAGRLEVFLPSFGTVHRVTQCGQEWSSASDFGLAPGPYGGGVAVFTTRDGRLAAFASSKRPTSSMDMRVQREPGGAWGPVIGLGRVPWPNSYLGEPHSVTEFADGRLRVLATEWNRDRTWEIRQLTPAGEWSTWRRA
ncbi:hypothetical protein [Kutzneria albida]|uniref:Exo-alpha-sialidase n=1 Tax=Kutzneria albida DSM 43870 TaxID=1449976 RepID=W5W708_9PSEU|nr:hypothetical protein [Kutzneria albida]AHH96540.1 hypothetical protein KALB_3173 [Kutzneria albida DSM 43870]